MKNTTDVESESALRRPPVVFGAVLGTAVLAIAVVTLTVHDFISVSDPGGALFLILLFSPPFVPIALALLDGNVGLRTAVAAMAAGIAAFVVVPRLVEKSIADDPSSTAPLVHIFDPVLMLAPICLVLGAGWAVQKLAARRARAAASASTDSHGRR